MSKNIDQIFIANPITSNAGTDLMYFGQSPYGVGNDAAMTYTNFSAQFLLNAANSVKTVNITDQNVTLAKLAPINTNKLLGNSAGILGVPGEITVGTGLTLAGGTLSASASGTVNSGLINQMAWYAASGTAVSGLATANNGVLFTSGAGVPSIGTAPIVAGGTGVTSVTVAPAASAWAGWDANKNLSANSFIEGYRTTATAAGTTTLVVGDAEQQYFTGITTQTVVMPVTSTLVAGQQYQIVNLSSGVVTVQSSGANTIQAMATNTSLTLTVINTGVTTAAGWNAVYLPFSVSASPWVAGSGSGSAVGGDGTCTSVGANSLAYGTNATKVNSAFANPGFAFGDNVAVNGKSFASGRAITIGAAINYCAAFGDNITISNGGNYSYGFGQNLSMTLGASPVLCWGSGCTVNGNFGVAFGNTATCTNNGSVVWGDGNSTPVTDAQSNSFYLTFNGGVWFYSANTPTLTAKFLSTGCFLKGTTTNDNAATGQYGEFVSSVISSGSAIACTRNVATNITSISLSAGDWDVWGNVTMVAGNGTTTGIGGWVSSTSATLPDGSLYCFVTMVSAAINAGCGVNAPQRRFSLASTTTIYLSAFFTDSAANGTVCGAIYARRVR